MSGGAAVRPDARVVSVVISDIEELERVGSVSTDRYRQLVDRGRALVEVLTGCQFALGDLALEIEPMRLWGGSMQGSTVIATLEVFAEEIGVPYNAIDTYRWVSSRWPVEHRDPAVGWTVHKTLAAIHDEEERFAAIGNPPEHPRLGRVWTQDGARRLVVTIIIDSQSVKAAETVSAETRGYDGGKKINGRKRHVVIILSLLILQVVDLGARVEDIVFDTSVFVV